MGSSLRHVGSFVAVCGLFVALRCVGFSLVVVCGFSLSSCDVRAPERVGSVVAGHRLSH